VEAEDCSEKRQQQEDQKQQRVDDELFVSDANTCISLKNISVHEPFPTIQNSLQSYAFLPENEIRPEKPLASASVKRRFYPPVCDYPVLWRKFAAGKV
jgi:hypothetical protein